MSGEGSSKRGDGWIGAALAGAFLGLYGLTLCRTVYWYDSAELATAAFTLGITHPPGYPLYTLVGHVFTWLPVEPAVAVNLMSSVFGAVAVGLAYGVHRELGLNRMPSIIGAVTLGFGGLFWWNAVVAEVYCPAVAACALVLWLLLRGLREQRVSLSLAAAWIGGLALGLHLSVATLGIGFAWLVWRNGRRVGVMFAAAGLTLLGSLVFLYVPFRAAQDPALNVCDPSTPDQLVWYLSGGAYRDWFRPDVDLLGRGAAIGAAFEEQLGLGGIALVLVGIAWLSRQRTEACLALVLMAAGNIAFFFGYQAHDVEVFLLPTTLVLCSFVAAGAHALSVQVSRAVTPTRAKTARYLVSAMLWLVPLALAHSSYPKANMRRFDETERFLQAAVEALPTDATIWNFTTPAEWKRYAVFGMYGQLVRGLRPDVTHVIAPDLRELARTWSPEEAIYVYAPVEMLGYFFEMQPEGPFLRVVSPKPNAALEAPRKRKKGRTCWN